MLFHLIEHDKWHGAPNGREIFVESDDAEAVRAAFPDNLLGRWEITQVAPISLAEAVARENVFLDMLKKTLSAPTVLCQVHGHVCGVKVNHIHVCSLCEAEHRNLLAEYGADAPTVIDSTSHG